VAWTPPATWYALELVSASDLNAQIRDNMLVLVTPIDTATGKIKALSSANFVSLDGTNLTGVAKLASANAWTAGKQDFSAGTARLVLPVGAGYWAT